jgi:hypothetical protein
MFCGFQQEVKGFQNDSSISVRHVGFETLNQFKQQHHNALPQICSNCRNYSKVRKSCPVFFAKKQNLIQTERERVFVFFTRQMMQNTKTQQTKKKQNRNSFQKKTPNRTLFMLSQNPQNRPQFTSSQTK